MPGGAPNAMAHKVVWDSALYFGTHALLFRNRALGDPATNDQHVVSTAALRMMSAGDLPISEGVARALAAYAVRTVEP